MKKLLFLIVLITINTFCHAQVTKITGKVIDSKSKIPLSYVTISCKEASNNLINGTITNLKGEFTIQKIPLKKILLSFQYIGYKTQLIEVELTSTNFNIDLGIISLVEYATHIDEVEIQAETTTVIQKIDKKIINIGNDLVSTGGNSFEMLQNIPSIDVNQASGTVSLRGNENVRILINGKPSNLSSKNLLSQIPSSSVKSIEIITNPSAKYTPEGMSGILNIILKKNTKIGFNGTISSGITYSKNTRPEASLSLNYKTESINFHTNYNTDWGDYATFNSLYRTDKNLLQNIDFLNKSYTNSFKIGADIYLSEKSMLSLYTSQNFNDNSLQTNTLVIENSNTLFNSNNLSEYDESEQAYNIDYLYKLDSLGQNIEIELNHTITKNPEKSINSELKNPNSKEYNYTNNIIDTRKLWLLNIDYIKPIKSGKIEIGIEYRKQGFKNNILTDQEKSTNNTSPQQPIGNTNLNYNRSLYSGYINFNKDFSKLSFQTGVRFEQFNLKALFNNTQQAEKTLKDNIFSVYPSAYITYHITDNDDLQLGYSRRVDRPSSYQITPIQEWVSPLSISKGNLNIKPQFTNSLELNYTKSINKGYFTFGTFYRKTQNKIGRFIEKEDANPDKQIISFTNYDFSDSYGVEFSASFKPIKWWTIRPSFQTYIQDSEGILNNKTQIIKNTRIKSNLSNSFNLSKKLNIQLSSIYSGKNENVQYTIKPYTMVNIAARLSILNKKGKITVKASDIFNNLNFDYTAVNPFPQKGKYILEYNTIYFGFSYNFGSVKNRAKKRKYRDNNESQGGLF